MTKQYQLIVGKGGDCLRATIASILEVDTASLPHFSSTTGDQIEPWNEFLKPANLQLVMAQGVPYEYYIAGVEQGGVIHACVGRGRGIVHDPCPGTTPPFDKYKIVASVEIVKIDKSQPIDLSKIVK